MEHWELAIQNQGPLIPTPGLDDGGLVAAVEAIYETALVPERWPQALQLIADVFGDIGTTLTYHRRDGRLGVIVSPLLLPGQEEYNREWYRHDIRAQRVIERMYFPFHTLTDHDLGLEVEHDRHPFFTQFLRKYGLRWCACINIAPDPEMYAFVSVHRSDTKSAFNADECAKLMRLGRHLEKSLRLGIGLIENETASLGFQQTFDRLDMGVFTLDGGGRIVFCNKKGEALLGDALEVVDERITARSKADRPAVQSAIAAMLRAAPDDMIDSSQPVVLTRAEGAPLVIYVLPLRAQLAPEVAQFLLRSQAIVLAIEARAGELADPALVRDLLGLTLGEARVAALIAIGMSPREVSQRLDITEGTARTVLKRVFAKSGISRQSELAALMAKVMVGPAAG